MPSLKPSTPQLNEGESLSTLLEGFAPGTTLFYKVVGRGVSKKDFAAGAVKGSVKVDANGVASIAHTLKADKKTEGAESFSIQVFSDKKMRNLVGQSNSVEIGDTSVKAAKRSGGNGGGKDAVTGLFMEVDGTRFTTDTVYDLLNSEQAQALKKFFGANYQSDNGMFSGGGGWSGEFEFGESAIVITNRSIFAQEGIEELQRVVYIGSFKYGNDGALAGGSISEVASWTYGKSLASGQTVSEYGTVDTGKVRIKGHIWNGSFPSPNESGIFYYDSQAAENGVASDSKSDFFNYQSSKYFEQDWWNNPFATNLI